MVALQEAESASVRSDNDVAAGSVSASVQLPTKDNGREFAADVPPPGLGLNGIAERVSVLGGTHSIRSIVGLGTTISLSIPLPATDTEAPVTLDISVVIADDHPIFARDELCVSVRTVEHHRANVASKLSLKGRLAILQFAVANHSQL